MAPPLGLGLGLTRSAFILSRSMLALDISGTIYAIAIDIDGTFYAIGV